MSTSIGYNLQTGSYANLAAAIKTAMATKRDAVQAAETVRQQSFDAAREALRAAGDFSSL